jgi:UDP-2,3-diacylglucosamine hydrolase
MAPRMPRLLDLPPMEAPVTVVGDVHLDERLPEIERRFLAWLRRQEGRGGTVVLLGDVFDAWIGSGQEREAAVQPALEALRRLAASGVRLCFQPGNRDFLLKRLPGVALEPWPDVVRTTWGGRRVLLTHGDLLVTEDPGYQRMRRILRARSFQTLLAAVPYRGRQGLAQALRRASARANRRKARRMLDIDYGLARRWLEEAQCDLLVAGHVHTGVHHRLEGPTAREGRVLKDWDREGGVVRFDGSRVALLSEAAS